MYILLDVCKDYENFCKCLLHTMQDNFFFQCKQAYRFDACTRHIGQNLI